MPRSLTSLVLAVLAVLALLTNPVAAAAAQAACAQPAPAAMAGTNDAAMAGMPMAGADLAQVHGTSAPCCDHGGKSKPAKDCAQICALACAATPATPAVFVSLPLIAGRASNAPRLDASSPSHAPSGLDRPPKTFA
jgi:hypothetical protein